MEINKESLENIGFKYTDTGNGFIEAAKGCITLFNTPNSNGWVIYIEYDHDYSNESSPLSFDDIVQLDKILNKND